MSTIINAEEGQPPSNDPEKWLDTLNANSKLQIARFRLEFDSLYGFECQTGSGIESETKSEIQREIGWLPEAASLHINNDQGIATPF